MAGFDPSTWPTFQQSMPMAQGAMTGEALQRAYLQNKRQKQQNQFQPSLDQAQLEHMQASTQGQNISNTQAPKKLRLNEYQSWIAAKNAAHGAANIQLQRDKMGALYGNMAARAANTPGMQSLIGSNKNIADMFASGMGGAAQKFAQVEQGGPPMRQQQIGQPQAAPQEPDFQAIQRYIEEGGQFPSQQQAPQPSPQQPQPAQQYMQGGQGGQPAPQQQQMQPQQQPPASPAQQYMQGGQQPQQQQQQQQQPISDDQVKQMQDSVLSRMQKQNTTAQILNQRQFASIVKSVGDPIEPMLQKSSKYFGLSGKANLAKDIAQSKQKKGAYTTPELVEYRKLADQFTLYANDFGRMLGQPSTDKGKQAMKDLVSPNWIMDNPNIAVSRFRNLRENEQQISKKLSQSTAQTQAELAQSGSQIGQQPQAQSPSLAASSSASSAPAGTVEMIDENGQYRPVPSGQLQAALKHGWRQANG